MEMRYTPFRRPVKVALVSVRYGFEYNDVASLVMPIDYISLSFIPICARRGVLLCVRVWALILQLESRPHSPGLTRDIFHGKAKFSR